MEKLVYKRIESNDEIDLFLSKFENFVGVRLPEDYARNSDIVGVFLHDKMVGGYMIVTKPNFRCLMFVPDAIKKSNPFFKTDPYEMMEVNGLWISPVLKSPDLQLSIWFHLVRDIFMARKKNVLLMRDLRNRTTKRLFNMANPTTLYQGAPELLFGNTSHKEIHVSYTSRWSILLNFHKYWRELKERQVRATKFQEQRTQLRELKEQRAKAA